MNICTLQLKDKTIGDCKKRKEILAEHLIGLDLFRLLSIMVIFLFHTAQHIGCDYGLFQDFIGQGSMFMTAFFMLSGFVLSYINWESDELTDISNIKTFYLKRFIGIVPVYWIVAVLYTLYSIICVGESIRSNVILVPIELMGLQSVFDLSHNSGTWFVSCILFCYVAFPFLRSIIRQMQTRRCILFEIVLIGILFYSPIVVGALDLDTIYSNPFFRLCEFCIGMLLCSIWISIRDNRRYKKYFAKYWVVIAELFVLILGVSVARLLGIPSVASMLYSWIGIPVFSGMILTLCGLKFTFLKNSKILRYLCEISYVFYLAQFFTWPICRWIFGKFDEVDLISSVWVKISVALAICLFITVVMHEFVEKPVTGYLRRKLL